MTKFDQILYPFEASRADPQHCRALAIGARQLRLSEEAAPSGGTLCVHLEFDELRDSALAIHDPQLIFSPVVAKGFDCIDVAARLSELNFAGAYRALTHRLPNPDIVKREVRAVFPELDFDVLTISDAHAEKPGSFA